MTIDPTDPLGLFAVVCRVAKPALDEIDSLRAENMTLINDREDVGALREELAECDAQRMSLAVELRATRQHLRDLVDWGYGADAPDDCIRAHKEVIEYLDATPGHGGEGV